MGQTFLGIDVGKTGAIAVISGSSAYVEDCPIVGKALDFVGIAGLVAAAGDGSDRRAALEKVTAFGMGRTSAFSFGMGYGAWQAALAAQGIPCDLVRPQDWKRSLGLPVGADKDASRAMAIRLFPALREQLIRKRDDGRAEALLIAEWCRRHTAA